MLQMNEENSTRSSPTLQSMASAELRSPTVPSSFSQADTVLTSRTHYTANTGGRARQSWRSSLNGLLRTPNFLLDEGNRSTTRRPNSIAKNSTSRAASPQPAAPSSVPAIELPASPVAGPGEPRSFFDSDSDSDSESDGELVLSRASSVRTQKPQLVEHNTNATVRSLRAYDISLVPSVNAGLSPKKIQQDLSSPPNALHDLSPPGQQANPNNTRPGQQITKPRNFLGTRLENLTGPTSAVNDDNPLEIPGGPADALNALTANALDRTSTNAIAPSPSPESDPSYVRNSIIKVPSNPASIQDLSTLPSPILGFDTIRVPYPHALESRTADDHPGDESFHQFEAAPEDALGSNLVCEADISRLHRAVSAPPLPFRHLHRKVTIRTLDLEATGTNVLRQSVVSTPHPKRAGGLAVHAISPLSAVASTKLSQALPATPPERDRFPSPARPELLYLEFTVARHPSMTLLVQIKIEDRSTYDDEALFEFLGKSYRESLLGMAQYLVTARALQGVTCMDPRVDTASFLKHLRWPRAGHKRKTWLIWLREHQVKPTTNGSEKGVSVSSPVSAPRMPFFKPHPVHPRLTFHFEFSLVRVALAMLWIITMSALAAILWVLFGVPGLGAAHGHHDLAMPIENWQVDAQGRVLTGLVLGVFVALLGTLGGAGWIGGSWLVL